MKVFIDPKENPPNDSWVHVSSLKDFISIVDNNEKMITHLSTSNFIDGINTGLDAAKYAIKSNNSVEIVFHQKHTPFVEDALCKLRLRYSQQNTVH